MITDDGTPRDNFQSNKNNFENQFINIAAITQSDRRTDRRFFIWSTRLKALRFRRRKKKKTLGNEFKLQFTPTRHNIKVSSLINAKENRA